MTFRKGGGRRDVQGQVLGDLMRRSETRAWPLVAAAVCLLVLPACQNRPQPTNRAGTVDPTDVARPTPNDVPRIARGNPAAEVQGGAQFQRVNALIGQWDLAQAEGMQTLDQHLIELVRNRLVSVDEARARAVDKTKFSAAAAAPAAAGGRR